jgi:hypothetical protein
MDQTFLWVIDLLYLLSFLADLFLLFGRHDFLRVSARFHIFNLFHNFYTIFCFLLDICSLTGSCQDLVAILDANFH